jgi:hypothetical protein
MWTINVHNVSQLQEIKECMIEALSACPPTNAPDSPWQKTTTMTVPPSTLVCCFLCQWTHYLRCLAIFHHRTVSNGWNRVPNRWNEFWRAGILWEIQRRTWDAEQTTGVTWYAACFLASLDTTISDSDDIDTTISDSDNKLNPSLNNFTFTLSPRQ